MAASVGSIFVTGWCGDQAAAYGAGAGKRLGISQPPGRVLPVSGDQICAFQPAGGMGGTSCGSASAANTAGDDPQVRRMSRDGETIQAQAGARAGIAAAGRIRASAQMGE
jgi:hypothetical protein